MSSTRGSEGGAGSSKASGPATGKVDGVEIDITTAGAGTLFVQQSYVSARDNAEVEGEDSRGASAGAGSDKSTKKSGASGRPLSRGGRIGRSKAKELMDDYKRAAASSASTSRSRGRRRTRDWDEWPPSWEQVCAEPEEALDMESPDLLLERGIADYTFLPAPGGLLGKGKFSTVYKVIDSQGRYHALKHTPLHPHHPLIAARLLREPTLLAHLPTHPCLIKVDGWIRTQGHFYLVGTSPSSLKHIRPVDMILTRAEEYASHHVPLPALPLPIRPSQAAYILDQLVSVIRDCLHYGRVCHRDLKGENVMIDPETGDVIVLDLGLATQFTMDEPRLTTCCGSPAFHSPEIVHALNHPPGAVTYFGPELDIWCIALTLLSLLLYIRYPLGPKHRSRRIMGSRVADVLRQLDNAYPPARPAGRWKMSEAEHQFEQREWVRVRRALALFLDINGARRMVAFQNYTFGAKLQTKLHQWQRTKENGEDEDDEFRQLSFVKGTVKHPLPLSVVSENRGRGGEGKNAVEIEGSALGLFGPKSGLHFGNGGSSQVELDEIPEGVAVRPVGSHLTLSNPTHAQDDRVLSFLKYLFRTKGILYHTVTDEPHTLFQLILPVKRPVPAADDEIPPPTPTEETETGEKSKGWLPEFLRGKGSKAPKTPRSVSLPARPPSVPRRSSVEGSDIRWLRCMARIEFDDRQHRPPSTGLGAISIQNGSNGSSASLATMDSLASAAARSLSAHASLGMTKKHAAGTWTLSPRSPLPIIVPSGGEIMGMETPPTLGEELDDHNDSPQSLAMTSLQNALLRIHTGRDSTASASPSAAVSLAASQPVSPTTTPGSATPSAEHGVFSSLPTRPPSKPGYPRASSQPRLSLHTQALRAYKGSEVSLGNFALSPAQSPTLGPISLPASRAQSRAGSRSSSVAPGSSRMPSRAPSLSTASLKSPHPNGRQLSRESTFASPEQSADEPPRVIIYFSDGRAVSPIRRAVEACQPQVSADPDLQPESPRQGIAIAYPTYPEATYEDDAAPERGRPRSRDEKYLGGASPLDWQGPGRYMRVRTTVKAVGKDGKGQNGSAGTRDAKERDNSRGRRLLQTLFGSAGLAAAYAGMQDTPSESGIRSASVPPYQFR